MREPHLALDLFRRHPDLCLEGYITKSMQSYNWKEYPHEIRLKSPYKERHTDKFLKSQYLDDSVVITGDFLEFMIGEGVITKYPSQGHGGSYFWKHRVEDFSTKHWLFLRNKKTNEMYRHQDYQSIASGIFIAMMREMGVPHHPDRNNLIARVHFGGRAMKALKRFLKDPETGNVYKKERDDSFATAGQDFPARHRSEFAGDRKLVHVAGLGGVPETFGGVSGHLPDGVD